MGQRPGQRLEGEVGARVRLALRQRAGRHRRGGRQPGQRQPVVEQRGGPLADGLQGGRAQLLGDPGSEPDRGLGARLQHRPHPARSAAGHVRDVLAVPGGQELDDRPRLAMGAGAEHEGVVVEFHAS